MQGPLRVHIATSREGVIVIFIAAFSTLQTCSQRSPDFPGGAAVSERRPRGVSKRFADVNLRDVLSSYISVGGHATGFAAAIFFVSTCRWLNYVFV